MLNPKTPGVFIQEVSTLPASVAPVATAIPAFIGYTEKRGNGFPVNTPTRITSLVEYIEVFGGPFDENYTITIVDGATQNDPPSISASAGASPYLLYYYMQMYFANGGGPCYVVSVGLYDYDTPGITKGAFESGINALEEEDEPTLLLAPESTLLTSPTERKDLYTQMLAQCKKLQDRFTLMDVLASSGDPRTDGLAFRNNEIGTDNLNYGAAYYPSLKTSIPRFFRDATVNIQDDRGSVGNGPFQGEALGTLLTGTVNPFASGTITVDDFSVIGGSPSVTVAGEAISFVAETDNATTASNIRAAINGNGNASSEVTAEVSGSVVTITANAPGTSGNSLTLVYAGAGITLSGDTLTGGDEAPSSLKAASATITITSGHKKIEGNTITIGGVAIAIDNTLIGTSSSDTAGNIATEIAGTASIPVDVTVDGTVITLTNKEAGVVGNSVQLVYSGSSGLRFSGATLEGGVDESDDQPDSELYNRIKALLNSRTLDLYPSAAMAGIYARVDRDRGVWKAPANVSVNAVSSPAVMVTSEEQGSLNVDSVAGKSINVIRNFTGKGTLVWGARTLAGNDNEWRYVPVRRLFIFIEESIQKATEPTVFEPNDANTWTKLRTLIENFLTSLWREGALAGAAPSDAFFVKVGLGETMTALDILEGRLNVEIGIAAVRPAEFIILKFSHKLQE